MKDIKDYLHLYLGCECVSTEKKPGTKRYILSAITTDGLYEFKTIPEKFSIALHDWKPILRPLSDMTEEEKKRLSELTWKGTDGVHQVVVEADTPDSFHYMLSIGIDLFGLIESGLAIDKTKL